MPPLRTMPPAKALKTERTHEENQERAYIAASRRSDRSLEARVESARRASEIHKRRTGRSLRVTEQDVVNEEMYEEEDDDLPLQYRRLTAHLQTGSPDFNRRLSAYLTNHVAMRSALDQAITNSYAQQYPNAPQFAHNQAMYPSPFMSNMPPQQSPRSYGQPYPTPSRTNSHSQPQSTQEHSPPMSAPSSATNPTHSEPRQQSQSSHTSSSHSPLRQRSSVPQTPQSVESKREDPPALVQVGPPPSAHQHQQPFASMEGYPNMSPFSMSLPIETQMLLGGALDPNDPMTSAMMGGNDTLSNAYNYHSQPDSKSRSFSHSYGGMSSTLAPSALDMQSRHYDYSQPPSTESGAPASAPPSQLSFDNSDFSKGHFFPSSASLDSGTATPGVDAGWDAFINDNPWGENLT